MNSHEFFIYLLIMAVTTYLIRVLPFVAVKEKIKNPFICSFLHYIPYAALAAMTVPAVFYATSSIISAAIGFTVAIICSLRGAGLTKVAAAACIAVFLAERIIEIFPM